MKKKLFLSAALAITAALNVNAQLLYKISGNNLEKPSYIIGTYHMAPVSFTDSIPGLKEALNSAEQTYGELIMKELKTPENMTKMQAAMMLPDGQTIDKLLSAEQLSRLNNMLKGLIGMDLSNPIMAQSMGKLTPNAISMQLSIFMYMKKNPKYNPQESFDGYFQEFMEKAGKPVKGFETIDFQIDAILKGSTMERQVEMLMCIVDNQEWNEEIANSLVNAFFAQDMNAMEKVLDMKLNNSCDSRPEEDDRMIYSSNANWLKAMPQIMREKSTFFAVGAAHLIGEKGVLAGLKKAGYNVEGVK